MHAVTFQAPGEVRVDERPDPELQAPDDAIVRIEATGVCGSDLHIFHGRVAIEPGFTIGHEYVGTVVAAGDARQLASPSATASWAASRSPAPSAAPAARATSTSASARGPSATGPPSAALQGTQAEQALVPHANLTLRRVPEGWRARSRSSPAT